MDLQFENHGSIWLIRPLSDTGREWLDEHIPDDAQTLGDAIACEPRYIQDIMRGAWRDGLALEASR